MDYVPHSEQDIKNMLKACGLKGVDELFSTIPAKIRQKGPSELPKPLCEEEALRYMIDASAENVISTEFPSFLGAGLYSHFIPSVIGNLLARSEFLTSYTPYQAEASQGVLQAIYEYQSMMAELTAMDVSNASSYDGATACADALVLLKESFGDKRKRVLVSAGLHPEYREVMSTYNFGLEMSIEEIPLKNGLTNYEALEEAIGKDVAGYFIQYPNCLGLIEDIPRLEKLNGKMHSAGGLAVAVNYPLALSILKPPGAIGFDIAVGEGQSLGLPLNFGGPLLGYFTVKRELIRKLPGRLVGRTLDVDGNEGFVLNLQAREQHIRREHATSNICTNEAMCALAAGMYLTYWGKVGFQVLGRLILARANYLAQRITDVEGAELKFPGIPFFNEIVVRLDRDPALLIDELFDLEYIAGLPLGGWFRELDDCMLLAVTESTEPDDMDSFCDDLEACIQGILEGGDFSEN